MPSTIKSVVVVIAAVAAAAGCSNRAPAQDPSAARTTTVTSAMYEAPGATPKPRDATPIDETFGGGASGASARTPSQPRISDSEIVAFTAGAHYAEMMMAEVARRRAVDADVKNYAVMMLTQHRDADAREKGASRKANLAPAEGAMSAQLANETSTTLATLKGQSDEDFDKAYIDSQIKAQERLLEVIDNTLLPSAQSGVLKGSLAQLRSQVAMHLAKAREVKQKL